MSTLRELAEAAEVATPEQIADAYAHVGIPRAPDVRRLEELAEPELDARNPHANHALTVAQIATVVAGLVLGFMTS